MLLLPESGRDLSYQTGEDLAALKQNLRWRKANSSSVKDLLVTEDVRCAGLEFACSSVQVSRGTEILNVIQGEVAVAKPGDGPSALGSESATTCHIVGFRNPSSGATCLAHLDDWRSAANAMRQMLHLMSNVNEAPRAAPLDVYIVGGYLGEHSAEQLSQALLSSLHASHQVFRVILACVSWINSRPLEVRDTAKLDAQPCVVEKSNVAASSSSTRDRRTTGAGSDAKCETGKDTEANAWDTNPTGLMRKPDGDPYVDAKSTKKDHEVFLPRQTSLAIDVTSGRAFAVRFEGTARGPALQIRSLRLFGGPRQEPLTEIYDARNDMVTVAHFALWMDRGDVMRLLGLPDKELLAATSTSPDAEDERFLPDTRSMLSYALANIGADGTKWWDRVFSGDEGRDLTFRRRDGLPYIHNLET